MVSNFSLIDKYNVPVPRFTSFPTVPNWQSSDSLKDIAKVIDTQHWSDGVSLYIHLPFCESLCTYCGCNKRITKNHAVEGIYIDYLLKEWQLYLQILPEKLVLKELHLGGGTPTFFSPENLDRLISGIYKNVEISKNFEASFEGHPNNTKLEHLKTLYQLGFRRVSFGVQDLDVKVQTAIHRIQPFSKVQEVFNAAKEIGYTSINFDLIYGLPFQNLQTIANTFHKVIELQPDRIAFYSYAHVPWVSKSQRAYSDEDIPKGLEKRKLYEKGKELLTNAGYDEIGMDHFALEKDPLKIAQKNKRLHRNFMGYTTNNSKISIGLGVSSISDFYLGYRQNAKTIESYYSMLDQEVLPIVKGIDLTDSDVFCRQHILGITCNYETEIDKDELSTFDMNYFQMMLEDGLIEYDQKILKLTEVGKSFVRNVAALFDKSYQFHSSTGQQIFSSSV